MLHTFKSIGGDITGSRKTLVTQAETSSDEHGHTELPEKEMVLPGKA